MEAPFPTLTGEPTASSTGWPKRQEGPKGFSRALQSAFEGAEYGAALAGTACWKANNYQVESIDQQGKRSTTMKRDSDTGPRGPRGRPSTRAYSGAPCPSSTCTLDLQAKVPACAVSGGSTAAGTPHTAGRALSLSAQRAAKRKRQQVAKNDADEAAFWTSWGQRLASQPNRIPTTRVDSGHRKMQRIAESVRARERDAARE